MKLSDYFNFNGVAYGFFMFFFIIFTPSLGLSSFLLDPITKWHMIFNIGVWFVLVMFCTERFFEAAEKTEQRRLKRTSTEESKK